jgi:dsDNA-binding SOS-regulon protein
VTIAAKQQQELTMQNLDEVIRERAYQLWVVDGRQDGNAETHWLAAQREVLASSLQGLAAPAKKVAKKAKAAPAPRRKKAEAA